MTELRDRTRARESGRRQRRRRNLLIGLGVGFLILLALGLLAGKLLSSGLNAKDSMSAAMAQMDSVTAAVTAGDPAAADAALGVMETELTAASTEVDDAAWRTVDWLPVVGDNIDAVRAAASTGRSLIADLARPAMPLVLGGLKPVNGAFDVEALRQLATLVEEAGPAVAEHAQALAEVDRSKLLGPVEDGIAKLDGVMATVSPILEDGGGFLSVLPAALGADGPRDYLLMFQGNSEARSLGGNPAVFLQIHVEGGAISIAGYANSSDFHSDRPKPIIDLDPEAVAIYGDKIARWTPDVTMPADFPTSVAIVRAFWAESFGTQVDGVLSVDPVALSYILGATGPITLTSGDTLSAENAASLLLNEVYFRYEDPVAQNAFFADASGRVFTALTGGTGSPLALVGALQRAAGEGRILYLPGDAEEAALIDGTRVSGSMPVDNADGTVIGVFANDNTGSKKSYYLDMSIDLSSTRCEVPDAATYSGSVTLTSTLTVEEAARLPYYITGPYYAPTDISTYMVLYGPVGGQLEEVLVDGVPAPILGQGVHLGRPAVKVEVLNSPLSSHVVDFTFSSPDASATAPSVWHTPMTRETPVKVQDTCG
ncbi:DUF4012 domain-containing protein [Microbacterium sp. A8/3-1]|uniref:DUF4012 domain-containing protein n=1 Tax=Microbacterium sp. A8/3-1 TaxID=3160749 RepID=A0AAU7W0G5_9MICO